MMFEIKSGSNGELILSGRFDASQVANAKSVLLGLSEGKTLDFARLDYISSAGLGILLAAQQRLAREGHALRLINVNSHIRDIFRFSGFDQLFEIG